MRSSVGLPTSPTDFTPFPGLVLQNLYSSNSFKYGSISSDTGTVTSATTTGVGIATVSIGNDGTMLTVNTGVVIKLDNTSAGASFVSGTTYDQAITLLHELGHAYWDLYGPGTSTIKPDGTNTKASMANTNRVERVCK